MKKTIKYIILFSMIVFAFSLFVNHGQSVRAESFHTVTFNYNAERVLNYVPVSKTIVEKLNTYSIEVSNGDVASENFNASKYFAVNYSFVWTVDGKEVDINTYAINKDTVFVGKWTPKKYKVYFTFESEDVKNDVTNLQEYIEYTVESPRINFYIPERPHYYFIGWYDKSSPIEMSYLKPCSSGDKIYTARWSLKQYFINYHTDTNSEFNPIYYDVECGVLPLSNPSKTGYVFKGWYSDVELKNKIYSIDTTNGGNIDVYPYWEEEVYTVTYVLPDGTTTTSQVKYGENATLPKLKSNIFQIPVVSQSLNNIDGDTTIEIRYVNIWYIYVLGVLLILGLASLIVYIRKRNKKTHNKLRIVYQSNSQKKR